ncbi:DNA alkylation repair protein [Streptomyces sp. AC495_CC817]|uniref:DNA alkylation repair protein n=1 Tax=Streptomyces sp. AC495_CC817 TaxID=2823900 RepID=UPI001C25E9F1|nr:DNA alkylation repair protein [Streptomyces sp. AC495_CC817]
MSTLADSIRLALRDIADPSLAPGQQAYMKSEMPFLGVRVPEVRRLTRRLARGITDHDALRGAALDLWRTATHREERYAATAITALRPLRGRLDMMDVHEEMIRDGAWWDHVDEVAHRVGDTLAAHPEEITPLLRSWSLDGDLWIRRVSIIAQLGRRGDTDVELLVAAIAPSISDPRFFLRKAIGWALRDYGRTDPGWVLSFVAAHEGELSGLTRREALKHLA